MSRSVQLDTITCMDCLDWLKTLPDGCVDSVITDPPYGISHSSNHGASWARTRIANDDSTLCRDTALSFARERALPWACFGTWKMPPPKDTRAALVWDKGPASGMGDLSLPWKPSWELIYVGGPGWKGSRGEGVLRGHFVITWESRGRKHPHEKPSSLLCHLLERLPTARVILDPFMGSGTTAVACIRTGRHFLGCEISPRYCTIARKRIRDARAETALFHDAERRQLTLEGLADGT